MSDELGTDYTVTADEERAERLGQLYREEQAAQGCIEMVCTFPHDGNCQCFNDALATLVAGLSGR